MIDFFQEMRFELQVELVATIDALNDSVGVIHCCNKSFHLLSANPITRGDFLSLHIVTMSKKYCDCFE